MREIVVRSRVTAQAFVHNAPWAAIQITNPDSDWPVLSLDNRAAVLQLRFPDRNSADAEYRQEDLFSEEHASQIIDFVAEWDRQVDVLLVHCEQGSSRSTAVGAALMRVFLPEADWYQMFARHSPNVLVYGRLLAEAERRRLFSRPD